jgi:hypothetical protein
VDVIRVAEAAELVHRGAGRDGIRLAALGPDVLQGGGPAFADVDIEALVD